MVSSDTGVHFKCLFHCQSRCEKTCLGCGQTVIIASGWEKGIILKIYICKKPQFHQFAKTTRRESFPIYGIPSVITDRCISFIGNSFV